MKKLLTILVVLLLFSSCENYKESQSKIGVSIEVSHKPIKTKKMYDYFYKFGKLPAAGKLVSEYNFNRSGNLTNEKLFYNEKTLNLEYIHNYDNDNNKTYSYLLEFHPFDTLLIYKHNYIKDLLDNTIIYSKNGRVFASVEYTYDKKNNLVEEKTLNLSKQITKAITHEYDKENSLTFTHSQSYGKTLFSEPFYHNYDSTGLMVSSIWYLSHKEPFQMKKYEYTFYEN